jgi:hypothetical protein
MRGMLACSQCRMCAGSAVRRKSGRFAAAADAGPRRMDGQGGQQSDEGKSSGGHCKDGSDGEQADRSDLMLS